MQCKSLENIEINAKNVTDSGIKSLAALPKLKELKLRQLEKFTGSAFEAFAGSKTLSSITIGSTPEFGDEGAAQIAKLPNLEALNLGDNLRLGDKFTKAGVAVIANHRMPAIFEFPVDLIDDDLWQLLVTKGWLYGPAPPELHANKPATAADVESIQLANSKVTDKWVESVLNCANLRSVALGNLGVAHSCVVTDESLKKLSSFKKLQELTFFDTDITGTGFNSLTELPFRRINVDDCGKLSAEAFQAFGKMATLERLDVGSCPVKGEWLSHISNLPKLEELDLLGDDIDDSAVKYLVTMPALNDLTLNDTKVSDAGFQELLKLPNLKELHVDRTKVSDATLQKAKKEHPNVRF